MSSQIQEGNSNHILHNPASDLDIPKVEKRLASAVLNEEYLVLRHTMATLRSPATAPTGEQELQQAG